MQYTKAKLGQEVLEEPSCMICPWQRGKICWGCAQGEPTWAEVAAEGETPEDCLGQKLSIKKRESAAIIKDVTLSYIKRLRALGWHLHGQAERCRAGAQCTCCSNLPRSESHAVGLWGGNISDQETSHACSLQMDNSALALRAGQ